MKKVYIKIFIVLLLCTMFASCGPSPEAIATMTASVWTPTPEPTLTPTPIPYDMELSLVGEEGENITFGASIEVSESEPLMMDDSGVVEILNLPASDVEIFAIAQGYEPLTETVTLDRGMNSITITMKADPNQINPATACPEGSKVILIEDFEDKKLQNWEGQVTRPYYDFVEIEGRGTVLKIDRTIEGPAHLAYKENIGNMVWHYDLLREPENGPMWMRFHEENERGAYISVHFGGKEFGLQKEPGPFIADRYVQASDGETWEKWSIVYFDGSVEAWLDDELHVGVYDDEPYTDGSISMDFYGISGGNTHIDNLVVCELAELYTPPAVETAEEE